jgi:hypothetical protein
MYKTNPTYKLWVHVCILDSVPIEVIDADYSIDQDKYKLRLRLVTRALHALIPKLDKTRLCRLMTMSGVHKPYFGNMGDVAVLPGGDVLSPLEIKYTLTHYQSEISAIMGEPLVLNYHTLQRTGFYLGRQEDVVIDPLNDI